MKIQIDKHTDSKNQDVVELSRSRFFRKYRFTIHSMFSSLQKENISKPYIM